MVDHAAKVAFALFSGPLSRAIPVVTSSYESLYAGQNVTLPEPGVGIYVANNPVILRHIPLNLDDVAASVGVLWWDLGRSAVSALPPRDAGVILPTITHPFIQHARVDDGPVVLAKIVLTDSQESSRRHTLQSSRHRGDTFN